MADKLNNFPATSGKAVKVPCRGCDQVILLQNYESHLRRKHPSLNPKDRSGKNDRSMKMFIVQGKRKNAEGGGPIQKKRNVEVDNLDKQKETEVDNDEKETGVRAENVTLTCINCFSKF